MEKFVNKIISGEKFNDKFLRLDKKFRDESSELINFIKELDLDSEKLKDLQLHLDPRSENFACLISFLRAECDNFTEDYKNEEFYNSIKRNFLKLQEFLNEE